MELLLSKKIDGKLAFPELEDVMLWGFDSGADLNYGDEGDVAGQAADRELILKIACVRSSTPGVTPFKRVCIDTRIMGEWEDFEELDETSFAKQLSEYVQSVEWL